MSGEFECFSLDGSFVDWGSDDGVDFAVDKVECGCFEGFEGRFASFGSWLS